jgi:hypothetical protein
VGRTLISAWILAVILGMGLVPAIAGETDMKAQNLYRDCKAPEHSPTAALCIGFISGIGNMMHINGVIEKQYQDRKLSPFAICGDTISNGAMVQAFMNWAPKHPESANDDQLLAVVKALRETWPCQ